MAEIRLCKLLCVYGGLVVIVPGISREQPIAISFCSSELSRAGPGEAAALLSDLFSVASKVGNCCALVWLQHDLPWPVYRGLFLNK